MHRCMYNPSLIKAAANSLADGLSLRIEARRELSLPDTGSNCSLGSLDGILRKYYEHRDDRPTPQVPEPFAWHALLGLCDVSLLLGPSWKLSNPVIILDQALMYLKCGKSHFRNYPPPKDWIPILHRDIKPVRFCLLSIISQFCCGMRSYYSPSPHLPLEASLRTSPAKISSERTTTNFVKGQCSAPV